MSEVAPDPRPPPRQALADFVRLARAVAGWKQDTLAYVSGVSLSTVQRVERGEPVGPDLLEKIGAALRQPPGTMTRARARLSESEAAAWAVRHWGWMADCEPVPVAPLRTQRQLRQLSDALCGIVDDDLGGDAADEIAGFKEWIDLLSFVRAEQAGLIGGGDPRKLELRRLYGDVLAASAAIERRHSAVCLVGVYAPEHNLRDFQGARIGVLAFRSRRADPAAARQRTLFAPRSVNLAQALREAWERDD